MKSIKASHSNTFFEYRLNLNSWLVDVKKKSLILYLAAGTFVIVSFLNSKAFAEECSNVLAADQSTVVNALEYYASNVDQYVEVGKLKAEVENNAKHKGTWGVGNVDQTSYETNLKQLQALENIISLNKGQRFVDLGSGLGLPVLYLASQNPDVEFYGYEIMQSKVAAAKSMAKRLKLENASFFEQDLSANFAFPEADFYYLFNPVNEPILKKLLYQIRRVAEKRNVIVITNNIDSLKKSPWLQLLRSKSGFMIFQVKSESLMESQKKRANPAVKHWIQVTKPFRFDSEEYFTNLKKIRPNSQELDKLKSLNLKDVRDLYNATIDVMLERVSPERRNKLKALAFKIRRDNSPSLASYSKANQFIRVSLPQKFIDSPIDYIIRIHEFTHLIQSELNGEMKTHMRLLLNAGFTLEGTFTRSDWVKAYFLSERGAMEWEWLFGHLIPEEARRKMTQDLINEELLTEENRTFLLRNIARYKENKREFLLSEAPERGYSLRRISGELSTYYMNRAILLTKFPSILCSALSTSGWVLYEISDWLMRISF